MAKKKETKKEVVTEEVTQVVEQPKVETPTVEPTKPKRVEKKNRVLEDGWEIKNRIYRLKGNKKPLSRSIRSANIHWFDEEKVMKENLNIVKIKKQFLLTK